MPALKQSTLKRVPNLDGMFLEDLRRYRKNISRVGPHYDPVREYCDAKIQAMHHRMYGNILTAISYENSCDFIYTHKLLGLVNW